MILTAYSAWSRTYSAESSFAIFFKAGKASEAPQPILPRASAAAILTCSSVEARQAISAGTALDAFAPMFPIILITRRVSGGSDPANAWTKVSTATVVPGSSFARAARVDSLTSESLSAASNAISRRCTLASRPICPNDTTQECRTFISVLCRPATRAGTALAASGPMSPKAAAATKHTKEDSSFIASTRAGTACLAFGPISPRAPAEAHRTSLSTSDRHVISAGTAPSAAEPILPSVRAAPFLEGASGCRSVSIRIGTARLPIFASDSDAARDEPRSFGYPQCQSSSRKASANLRTSASCELLVGEEVGRVAGISLVGVFAWHPITVAAAATNVSVRIHSLIDLIFSRTACGIGMPRFSDPVAMREPLPCHSFRCPPA